MKKELQLLFSRLFITSTLLLALFITLSGTSFAQAVNFQGGYGSHDMTNGTCINSTERQISDSRSVCDCNSGFVVNSSNNGCEAYTWTEYCPAVGDPNPSEVGYTWSYAKSPTRSSAFDYKKKSPATTCNPCPAGQDLGTTRGTSNPTCAVVGANPANPATRTLVKTEYAAVFGYTCSAAASRGGAYKKFNYKSIDLYWQGQQAWSTTKAPFNTEEERIEYTRKTYSDGTVEDSNTNPSLTASVDASPVTTNVSCSSTTSEPPKTPSSLAIYASPTTCTIPAGASTCTTTITFPHITPNDYNKCVYVTDSTNTEKKFACGSTGEATTATANWIGKGDFKFTVYKESNNTPERTTGVSVTVTGVCASGSAWNGSTCATGAAGTPGTKMEKCGVAQIDTIDSAAIVDTGLFRLKSYGNEYDSSKTGVCTGIATTLGSIIGKPISNSLNSVGYLPCGWYYKDGVFNTYTSNSGWGVSGTSENNFKCVYKAAVAPGASGSCDTTPLVAASGLGGTTGTYCENGALWSTSNWGTSGEKYKNISDQCVNGSATKCKYGCKQTAAGPTGGNNPSAHCMTESESGTVSGTVVGEPCRLFTSAKGFPGTLIDSSYNSGHMLTVPGYRNGNPTCVLDGEGGAPGNPAVMDKTWPVDDNSCWLIIPSDRTKLPYLGGNTTGSYPSTNPYYPNTRYTCKNYFALQCSVQFSNRITRSGAWDWDTQKCDYTVYKDQVQNVTTSGNGLNSSVILNSYTSNYVSGQGGTGAFAGAYNFMAIGGGLYANNWSLPVYNWGSKGETVARMGEWNGVNPNNSYNTVSLTGMCPMSWLTSSGPSGASSGPTSCPSYLGNDGLQHPEGYVLKTSSQGCCISSEYHLIVVSMEMCKNENYLQGSVRSCVDVCADAFSPVNSAKPAWCQGVTKTCSCAAKYNGTQGNYTVGGAQDCLTNAPATQPTTCAASVPTISCGVPTQTTITLSGSNVPTNSGACSLILSPSDYSSPSLTINSALQSTFTGQLASSLIPDKAYTASIICGGVTKASQSCRTAVATACTNGNTSQNIPSGSFNPTTMIARRVVESGAACLTTKPANVPDCMLPANSNANPTLYASQQLGAPSNAIANSDVCFDTVRNRMRVAADTGCADTGVRTTPVCPAPTTPSMLSLGTTVFVNNQAVVSFTPPKANMQCGLYGRNASGVDMTNIVSPIATYSSVSPVIITLGADKQSAVQTYGYTAICTDPGTTNTVQSGIINVNVVPAPTANIYPTAYDEGLATTTSLCTDADKWTITRITGTERVGQGLGTTNSSAYGFETGFNIFLRSRTADIEAGNGTDGNRYTAADVELTCTKTITSTIAVGVSGSPDLSTQQNQISQTATATLKLTTLTARVLIDKDGVFSTSPDRSPAAGIPVTYRMQQTSNTNNAKGDAIFITKVGLTYSIGLTYSNGFIFDNLPNYLEYMGTIAKDGTLADPNVDTMPSQVAGSCASAIPDSATLARYKAVHQGTSVLFNQADLDFVKSQSGKTCTAADTACNQADINGNGSVNATDVGIIRGMVGDMLVSTCALRNGFYDKDVANDTHVMLLKYKEPKLYPSIVSSTQAKVSCDIGDSLYVTKISPTPTASIISTKPYTPGTQVTFDYNPNYTYKLECANHGYATTTAMLAPELSVNVTQNPIVPISTDATVKWTSLGNSCEIKDFAGNSFNPKIEKTSTTGSFEYTFPANTPYFNMAVTHLPGATAPAATDIGLKVVCKDTSAPTVTATATANIIVYAPITASIAAPGADGKSTLSCGGTYDSAVLNIRPVLNIRQSPSVGNDTTLNTNINITLYDRSTTPVQGAVGPWQRTLLVSQINTLTCSGPYGPSATAVYPTGAFTLNAEINADVAQSTDMLTATSSAAQGRYTLLNWSTTGEGVTCNTKMTKLLPNGSYSAPVAASSLANTSLAIPTQGTYSNNPIVKWTIECKDKNDTVLTKTLTLNVGATPLAEIGTPTYNGRYYNPSTKEGAASTYEFALKCTNATSYQVQKSVGTNWVNATGTNASGAITTNPWTGVTYKQPYMNTVDGQQFRLMCVSSLGVEAYSNKVTFSTASTYPFVTSFRTTVQTYTVTGTTEPITISPVIRNPVDCKVSVFEASDVSGFTTLSQFTAKSPASGTTASAMQTQINTVYGYDGTTQIKLNTPAFQNGTQEGKINSVNLDKAKTFILACPKYNTATQSSTVEICNQNNTSAKCIFTITKSTTGQQ